MAIVTKLTKEKFTRIIETFDAQKSTINVDYLYDIYETVNDNIEELYNHDGFENIQGVNPFEIVQYILGEYFYNIALTPNNDLSSFLKNDNIKASMASVVADKYISLTKLNHNEKHIANKYYPPISSLDLYVNFMLTIVHEYERNDPKLTLITDLLTKTLSICRCTLDLLVKGFETEAFSSWRTLHESECILILLDKYGEPLINRYIKHMRYGLAFKDMIEDKDKQNEIFYAMKDEMATYGLKSKDIKKYIEYGWLYEIEGTATNPNFKPNFRDGLQQLAGLSEYSKRYEMSSEIIHSTPMLIYSNKEYFYYLTLLSTYESFFRLEKIFLPLFASRVREEEVEKYAQMRKVYYTQLLNIYKIEIKKFELINKH